MKKIFKVLAIIALVAVIGFSMACGGGTGDSLAVPQEPTLATYTSTDAEGNTYVLTISKGSGRAAYNPQKGDNYEFKAKGKTSKGTVTTVSGGEFKLTPTGSTEPFTVTITGGNMTAIEGTITFTDGTSEKIDVKDLTPGTSSVSDTFSITASVEYDSGITNLAEAKAQTNFIYWYDGKLSDFINEPASVTVNNSKLTIKLGVPKTEFLEDSEDLYFWDDVVVIPSNAKFFILGDQEIFWSSDPKLSGSNYLLCCKKDDDHFVWNLIYVDRDVKIEDEGTSYNIKKGWNYLLSTEDDGVYRAVVVNNLPDGYKWIVKQRNW